MSGRHYSRVKGRGFGDRFAAVPQRMMDSPAWLDLSGVSVKLLLRLILMSKGNNGFGDDKRDRGRLFMSEREAARLIGVSKNTAARALAELIERGFLRVMQKGCYDAKGIATTWRLTFQPYPHGSMGPTNEWEKWQPAEKKSQAQKLTTIGSKTDQLPSVADEIDARIEPIGPISADPIGSKTAPHIESTMEGVCEGVGKGAQSTSKRAPSVDDPLTGANPPLQEIVRRQVSTFCQHLDARGRSALAARVGLTPDELGRFDAGRLILQPGKLVALRRATMEAAA